MVFKQIGLYLSSKIKVSHLIILFSFFINYIKKIKRTWNKLTVTSDICDTAKIMTEYKSMEIPADLIVFITSQNTSGMEKILARSSTCFVSPEAYNRPVAGQINILPENIELQASNWALLYNTLLHEMIHVLGFNFDLFKYFVDSSGVALGIDNVIK